MTLAERVAAALNGAAQSSLLEALLTDVRSERRGFELQRDQQAARSLDPAVERSEALTARGKADDAKFEIARLDEAVAKLEAAREKAKTREASSESRAEFERAKATRDQLVMDLQEYRALARQIVALLIRIEESDAEIASANRNAPSGEKPLESAEFVARKIPGHLRDAGGMIPRLTELSLPAFHRDDLMKPLMWHRGLPPNQRNPG